MKIIIALLMLSFSSLSLKAQPYQYLRLVIDTSANLQLRELEWFDDDVNYPIPAMTAYNAPSPLLVTGDNANWERYRIYDDNPAVHAWVGYVSALEDDIHEFTLDLGIGNSISPDSVRITKPPWGILGRFRVLLSNDEINWDLFLDTTLMDQGFDVGTFPLALVVDLDPPDAPQNLIVSCKTSSQVYLDWDAPSGNDACSYYIFQDGGLIDSTLFSHYAVQDLTANTSYGFHVTSLDCSQNESSPSSTINEITLVEDNTSPSLFGNISVLSSTASVVDISWNTGNDNQGLAGYLIQLDGTYIGTSGTTEFSFSGLEAETTYTGTVRAKDFSGNLSSPITITFTTEEGSDKMVIGTNFWSQIWSQDDNQLFINGYQNVEGPNPWKPELLDELDYAQTLRFMEMQHINGEPTYIWLDRKMKANVFQDELAFGWMIDLCNRKNSNLWLTVPNQVIDRNRTTGGVEHYIKKLAILIKTGIDMGDRDLDLPEFDEIDQFTAFDFKIHGGETICEPLAPGLKIYIEYGNENWNGSFPQSTYCAQEGLAMGLGWGPVSAGRLFNAYASIVLFEDFEQVFGTNNSRIKKVLPIQAAGLYYANLSFTDVFDNATYNPTGVMPDIVSGHTYFGHGSDGADPDIEQILNDAIAVYTSASADLRALLDDLGAARNIDLKMISYEGGHHVVTNYAALNANPIIYDVYLNYLDSMDLYYDEVVLFSHVATNAFGLKQYIDQPIADAHKYRAVIEWGEDLPLPVTLSGFYGKIEGGKVKLNWSTFNETNNKGFIVEKSGDGVYFDSLAFVKGRGDSDELLFYDAIDHRPWNGPNYYRIQQLDLDGKKTYSNTIIVQNKLEKPFQVSPNPFSDLIDIRFSEDQDNRPLRIIDTNGLEVLRTEVKHGTLDLKHLTNGVYFLIIDNDVLKIIKS